MGNPNKPYLTRYLAAVTNAYIHGICRYILAVSTFGYKMVHTCTKHFKKYA
jgi:hypothetical protein